MRLLMLPLPRVLLLLLLQNYPLGFMLPPRLPDTVNLSLGGQAGASSVTGGTLARGVLANACMRNTCVAHARCPLTRRLLLPLSAQISLLAHSAPRGTMPRVTGLRAGASITRTRSCMATRRARRTR